MRLDHSGRGIILVALSLATIAESGHYNTEARSERTARAIFECKEEGYHADPEDCKSYYRCVSWGNSEPLTKFKFECGPGTVFSKSQGDICVHPSESERKECGGSDDDSDKTNDVDSNNTYEPEKEKPQGKPESRPPSPSTTRPTNGPSYVPPSNGPSSHLPPTAGITAENKPSSIWASSTESIGQVSNNSPGRAQCEQDGFIEDPDDCSKFYRCVDQGSGIFKRYDFTCGVGTVWDPKVEACNHAWAANRVGCKVNSESGSAGSSGSSEGNQLNPDNPNPTSQPTVPCQTEHPPHVDGEQGSPGTEGPQPNPTEETEPKPQQLGEPPQGPPSVIPTEPADESQQSGPSQPQEPSSSSPSAGPDSGNQAQGTTKPQGVPPSGSPADGSSKPEQTPKPTSGGMCSSEGFFGDPKDCRKFYRCVGSSGKFTKYDFECGEGTVWDEKIESCNHAYAVPKCSGGATGTGGSAVIGSPGSQQPAEGSNEISSSEAPVALEGSVRPSPSPVPTTISAPVTEGSQSASTESPVTIESSQDVSTEASPVTESSQDVSTQDSASGSEESSSPTTEISGGSENVSQGAPTSPPTPTPTYLPPSKPQEPPASGGGPLSDGKCTKEGFFSDPQNCKKFYRCVDESGKFVKYEFECGEGTAWDDKIQSCNHAYAVPGCAKDSVSPQGGSVNPPTEASSGSPPTEGSTSSPSAEESSTSPPAEASSNNPPPEESSSNPSSEGTSGSDETTSSSPDESSSTNGPTSESSSSEQTTSGDNSDSTTPSNIPVSATTNSPAEETESPTSTQSSMNPESPSPTPVSTTDQSSESNPTTPENEGKPSDLSGSAPTAINKPVGSNGAKCNTPGFFANENDCTKFYRCVGGGPNSFTKYEFSCAPGTAWDQRILTCNHMDQVSSCKGEANNEIPNENKENGEQPSSTQTESSANPSIIAAGTSAKPVDMTATPATSSESSESTSSSSSESSSEESPESSSTTQPSSAPKPDNSGIVCNKAGFYAHPSYCEKFYRCVDNGNGFNVYYFDCAPGTIFDPSISVCNYPESVYPPRNCKGGSTGGPSSPTETTERPNKPVTKPSAGTETTQNPEEQTTAEVTTSGMSQETTTDNSGTTTDGSPTSTETETTTDQDQSSTTPQDASTTESQTDSSGTPTSTESQAETTTAEETPSTTEMEQQNTESSTGMTTTESTTSGGASGEMTTVSSEVSGTTPCPLGALTGEQIVLVCPTGFKRHPKYCNVFYQCISEATMNVKILTFTCPKDTVFDDEKIQCLPESESSQPCAGDKVGARFYRRIESTSTSLMRIEKRETLCPGVGHYPYRDGCNNIFYKCKKDSRDALQGYVYKCPENFVYWSVSRRCERAARLPMCSQVSFKEENNNNTWINRWQLPVEDYNLSARKMRYP